METLIQHCVFQSVLEITGEKEEEEDVFPVNANEFYRNRVEPKLRALLKNKTVDIKRTKYNKLSNLFEHMKKLKVMKLKSKRGEMLITSVDRSNRYVQQTRRRQTLSKKSSATGKEKEEQEKEEKELTPKQRLELSRRLVANAAGTFRGAAAFEIFFAKIWTSKRWTKLRKALSSPPRHCARMNSYCNRARRIEGILPEGSMRVSSNFGEAFYPPLGKQFKQPEAKRRERDDTQYQDEDGKLILERAPYYILDPASIVPPMALDVKNGHRVLDMCAAPGGKSLIIAERLCEEGHLVSNDISPSRRKRLACVLDSYLPRQVRARVRVTGHDATRWPATESALFDRILLDAPCSTDRHLMFGSGDDDEGLLVQWCPSRIKSSAKRQETLLNAAVKLVRNGGRIVYSTCALAPQENDGVVENVLARHKGLLRHVPLTEISKVEKICANGDKHIYGTLFLPDKSSWGPIYVAVLEKKK
jgi:5-methylcytosine rRNA methyltransferase NSUN4